MGYIIFILLIFLDFAFAITNEERRKVIEVHNKLRSQLAMGYQKNNKRRPMKPAKNMNALVYDKELELSAQRWIDRCEFAHSNTQHVGENLSYRGYNTSTPESFDEVINTWWNEIDDCFFDENRPITRNSGCTLSHFITVANAKATKVGCASSACANSNRLYLICQYDKKGYINEMLYEVGAPCSGCQGSSTCNKGLCVVQQFTNLPNHINNNPTQSADQNIHRERVSHQEPLHWGKSVNIKNKKTHLKNNKKPNVISYNQPLIVAQQYEYRSTKAPVFHTYVKVSSGNLINQNLNSGAPFTTDIDKYFNEIYNAKNNYNQQTRNVQQYRYDGTRNPAVYSKIKYHPIEYRNSLANSYNQYNVREMPLQIRNWIRDNSYAGNQY